MEAVLDGVIVLMFLLSARSMLCDIFLWKKFGIGVCVGTVLAAICVSIAMRLCERFRKEHTDVAHAAILLVGLLGFLIYYSFRTVYDGAINAGLGEVFGQFTDLWNDYYGTKFLTSGGDFKKIPVALDFCLLLMGFLLLWTAKICGKRFIMGILPVLVFVAGLLVGYAPKISGLLYFVFGIILSNVSPFEMPEFHLFPGKRRSAGKLGGLSWMPVLLATALASNLLVTTASPLASTMIRKSWGVSDVIRQWIGEPEGLAAAGSEGPANDKLFTAWLSNAKPEFQDTAVISITMEKFPMQHIYLKDFAAGKYINGRWKADISSFEKYFQERGLDPNLVAQEVMSREVDALKKGKEPALPFGKRINITYLTSQTGNLAVPYFTELSYNDPIQAVGDSYYTRTKSLSILGARIWSYENRYEEFLNLFENPSSPLIAWGYDGYVQENFLEVPRRLRTVKELASTIYSEETDTFEGTENELRMHKAELVTAWLEANTEYSMDLPELPFGEDAIEFFLGESRQGYCMHYASAAAMMLRAMGVPARLATGYIMFQGDSYLVGNLYYAKVKDSRAHAWVEVYLDGMGWFPVEVTKGFRFVEVPPDQPPPTEPPSATDPTDGEEETEPTEETIWEEETQDTEISGTVPPGENRDPKTATGLLWFIGCAGLLTLAVAVFVLKKKRDYRNALRNLIHRKQTSLAIRMMNRRIYRKLRLTRKVVRKNLRDDGYEEVLKQNYPDIPAESWARYMVLVKAAAFSKQGFTDEEVAFCHEIYRKVIPNS